MQPLAPIEPRESAPRGAAATRLPWVSIAVAVSAAIVAVIMLNRHEILELLRRHTVLQAELAVSAGTLAGLLLSRMEGGPLIRRRMARLDTLYDATAAAPIRIEAGYTHYLPFVLLLWEDMNVNLSARMRGTSPTEILKDATGGTMYVGPAGVRLYLSATPSAPAPTQSATVIDLGSARDVTAGTIALPQGQLARVTRTRPRYAMVLRWSTGQAVLAVAAIGDTVPRLHRCLDELRWGHRSESRK
jgi:hypothetical protein